jgi:hypothetical protein
MMAYSKKRALSNLKKKIISMKSIKTLLFISLLSIQGLFAQNTYTENDVQFASAERFFHSDSFHDDLPLTLLKGVVLDSYGEMSKAVEITVTDNETGEIVGIYHPNSKTGKYIFILTPAKNYKISYEADGDVFYSENRVIDKKTNYYEIHKAIDLPSLTIDRKYLK